MTTARVKATAVSVFLLVFAIALLWQQARIDRLGAEATELRVQLEQAAAAAGENQPFTNLQPSTADPLAKDQFGELLRLRGEVGVLRRQLADALRLTPKEENLPRPEPPLRQQQLASAALDAELTVQRGKVDARRQKVEQLLTALNIPEDVANMDGDAIAKLSSESLNHYRPYFQAVRELEELERFTTLLIMKVNADHIEAQEDVPRRSSP